VAGVEDVFIFNGMFDYQVFTILKETFLQCVVISASQSRHLLRFVEAVGTLDGILVQDGAVLA
jgi:hypothetical protein